MRRPLPGSRIRAQLLFVSGYACCSYATIIFASLPAMSLSDSSVVPETTADLEAGKRERDASIAAPESAPSGVAEMGVLVLAVLALLAFMRWAEAFLAPLLFGILISYTLSPAVTLFERMRIPRACGALTILSVVGAAFGVLVYVLSDDVVRLTERVPEAAAKLRMAVTRQTTGGTKPLANLQKAASELEKAAAEAAGANDAAVRARATAPPAPTAALGLQQWLVAQTSQAMRVLMQIGTAFVLAFCLLSAGDAFRRKVVRLAGPTLARRRVAITMLNDIDLRIQRYMGTIVITNALLALATWALLAAIGIEHALFWGVVTDLLHLVPYVGTPIAAGAVAVAGLAQFGDLFEPLLAALGVLVISGLIGVVLATWMQSRTCRVNSVVVIGGVLFFGWLWGGWGLILAVPVLTVLRTVSDGIAQWRPLAEFLAE